MSTDTNNLRPEKRAMYAEVEGQISESVFMFLADSDRMTVTDTLELKKQLSEADAKVKIVKNRMLSLVCEGLGKVTGPTAVVTGSGDVIEVAKIIKKFSTDTKKMALKGAILEGSVLSAADAEALAKLPGKLELQAKLVGTLAAPMTQLVGVMNQKVCSLLYVLNAVRDKKEQAA